MFTLFFINQYRTMMKRVTFLALLSLTVMGAAGQIYLDPQAPIEQRVEDALGRMTLHEKIGVLHAQSKFTSAGVPRLGIRQLNMDDGPHGVREELDWNAWRTANWTNDSCVAFPSLTCLAATWNRDLARLYGKSVSEEFAYRGKDVMLGPGVNIQRTPLNGRAFEYMGEDPLLAAEMVVPYIEAVQQNGVACCLKHFALNNQETDRFSVNVNVSERALREIYLYPFEQAVKRAHVYTVMGSYNLWKNVHCSQNDTLLNRILKQEWGFDGALVSDWNAVTDTWQAATGGLDIEMGTEPRGYKGHPAEVYHHYYMASPLERLVQEGRMPLSVIDDKVRRVLRTIFRTSMNPRKVVGNLCSEAHVEACRYIAEEGIVLLKNAQPQKGKNREKLLPLDLSKYQHILVVGENATRSLTRGGGSSELKPLHEVSPLEALTFHFSPFNFHFSPGYSSGRALYDNVDPVSPAEQARLKAEALDKAREADFIIYVGGMNKNRHQDCENGDREGYDLSFGQNELISELADIQPNIVVVTFGGNPYAMPWLQKVAALVHCWYLGSESGNALVRVLTGQVNPSGKLPVTFARQLSDYPYAAYGAEAYPGVNRQVYYKEDIYVGYRGFDKRMATAKGKQRVAPLFPFGYGLSYTTYRYGKPVLNGRTVSIDVTNTGSRAGKETVQLYIGAMKCSEDRPVKELKDFRKIALQPGETQTVSFTLTDDMFRFFSVKKGQWTVEPGQYRISVAPSSAESKNAVVFTL